MRKLIAAALFDVFMLAYLTAFVAVGVGLTSEQFWGKEIFAPEMMGLGMLIILVSQVGWGIIAGAITHRRGWLAGNSHNLGNLVALTFLHFAFAAPTIIIAWCQQWRHGKFLPAPHEC
ncbi:MAG: hypothetical protein HUU49_01320 [Candidatus Buchananbacteria bacterium]|nr:hypothetical protein [Candidatus Buchananbacteria bacterium]